jgi:hypothetical protein
MLNFTAAFVIVYLLLFFANRFGARAAGVINGVPLIAGASYVLRDRAGRNILQPCGLRKFSWS